MRIEKIHEDLSVESLESFEAYHNLKLPKDYREFLLMYNGGYPNPGIYTIGDEQGESVLNIFYGIGDMYDNLEKKFDIFDEILEIGFIPIADDPSGNQICIGMNGEHFGRIYHWAHDEENDELDNMYFIANSLNEFLMSLYDDE